MVCRDHAGRNRHTSHLRAFLGDSGFQFSKETWNKLFTFSATFSQVDQTLRVMGQFTPMGEKELSDEAHTLEVYCQIPPSYGKDILAVPFVAQKFPRTGCELFR